MNLTKGMRETAKIALLESQLKDALDRLELADALADAVCPVVHAKTYPELGRHMSLLEDCYLAYKFGPVPDKKQVGR